MKKDEELTSEFLETLDSAIKIVSCYGKVLEASSTSANLFQPITNLPCSKDIIRRAISFLYTVLTFDNLQQCIRECYPNYADDILTEKYYNSLREGYLLLTTFIPEDEHKITCIMHPDREKLLEIMKNPNSQDLKLLMEKVASISNEYPKIIHRIFSEQKTALIELGNLLGLSMANQIANHLTKE